MKRHHLKSYQNNQYKVAEKRIMLAVFNAYLHWRIPDLNIKFDYEN